VLWRCKNARGFAMLDHFAVQHHRNLSAERPLAPAPHVAISRRSAAARPANGEIEVEVEVEGYIADR